MACFLVPAGEAVITTIIQKTVEKREKNSGNEKSAKTGIPWSRKLGWLNKLLWGGTILLALEHIWHGEVVPWPPFLTAMNNPADIAPMLYEMATIGGTMAVFITVVWGIIVLIAEAKVRSAPAAVETPAAGGA